MEDSPNTQMNWQGTHHLALVTRDLDATVRFYHGLLGMPIMAAMGPMPYHGRHCFFRAGHFFMHFFEQPDAKIAVPPVGWAKNPITFVPGAYQHIAFAMENEASLLALRERLIRAYVAITELMNQGPVRQCLLTDNNGIMIEVNWSPYDFITQPIDYHNSNMFNDPNPVPAVKEILREGHLRL